MAIHVTDPMHPRDVSGVDPPVLGPVPTTVAATAEALAVAAARTEGPQDEVLPVGDPVRHRHRRVRAWSLLSRRRK